MCFIWDLVVTGVGASGDPGGAMGGNDFVRTVSCYSQAAAAASGGGQSSEVKGGPASMAGSSQASSSALSGKSHSWPVKNITFWGVHQKRHIVLSIGPTEGSHEGGHNFLYLATIQQNFQKCDFYCGFTVDIP